MELIPILIALFTSYLIGSLPTGYLIGKFNGIDIREHGSGNIGATNVTRVVGKGPGVLVLIIDILKGLIPVTLLAHALYTEEMRISIQLLQILCCLSTIAGHNWTVFLKFKGGKGVATSAGALLGIAPLPVLLTFVVWLATVLLTRYVSLASLSAGVALPLIMLLCKEPKELIILGILIALVAVLRHRSNIMRLIRGEEDKFGEKE